MLERANDPDYQGETGLVLQNEGMKDSVQKIGRFLVLQYSMIKVNRKL